MTEFTLVITEFYTTNADGFAHQLAMCFGLVQMPILRILLYLALTLYAPEEDLCQKENQAHFNALLFPLKCPSNILSSKR